MINDQSDATQSAPAGLRNMAALACDSGRAQPFIARPSQILDDPALGAEEKRSILAAWLSDKYAVPDAPRWRQLENGAFVDTEDIWRALYALDDAARDLRNGRTPALRPVQRRQGLRWISAIRRRQSDDNDDPPPAPAALRLPVPVNPEPAFEPGPAVLLAA